jgi:hypothetical protein
MIISPGAMPLTLKTTQSIAHGHKTVLQLNPKNGCTQWQSMAMPPSTHGMEHANVGQKLIKSNI